MPATQAHYSQYFDKNGQPLDAGYVWFGLPNENPKTSPVNVYWDADLTQPASQPIRTLAGYLARNGSPAQVFTDGAYSQIVENKRFEMVYYAANSADYSDLPIRVAVITATDGQTLVNLPFAYTRGNNSLAIYLNGLLLLKDRDYTETSTTSVTMIRPLKVGPGGADEVTAIGGRLINAASAIDAVSAAALAAGSGAGLVGYNPGLTFPSGTVGEILQYSAHTVDAITSVPAALLAYLRAGDVLIAKGYSTVGDGGGGLFRVVSSGSADLVLTFNIGGGLFATRIFTGPIYAAWGGAKFDGVTDDTAALNRCLDAAGLLGGGKVICPQGTAILSDSNPGATNWDNNRALYMQYNNIVLEGQGEGTILQLANGADCHVIKIGQRVGGSSVTPLGCQVRQLKINGNRANQSTPTATDDHWDGVSVSSGCNNTRLQNLFISQVQYYGIGFQRNGFKDCTVAQVVIEDAGADGIDCKDDDGSSAGNVMFDVTVRRFGLVDKSILPLQAGINPRGGWAVSSVTVEDYASDRMGIRFESNVLAVNSRGSSCTDFVCRPSSSVETIGLMVNSGSFDYQTTVQGGRVFGGLLGVDFRVPRARASDISVDGAATGFQFTSEGTCTNLFAINCATTGYKFRSPGLTSVINGSARACGVGATFDSGADDCLLQGGRFSNNTTNISDSATGTQILNVAGIKTESRRAVAFAVTSVTEVTVTIPHGLAFTPALDSVVLSLQRDTVVTDYVIAYLNAYLTDATNVYCKVRITTASATGGATAKLLAFVVVKNGRN